MMPWNLAQTVIRSTTLCFILAFVMVGLVTAPSDSHEIRPTIADFQVVDEKRFQLSVSVNVEAAISKIGTEHSDDSESPSAAEYETLRKLESSALESRFKTFLETFLTNPIIRFGDQAVQLVVEGMEIPPVGDLSQPRLSTLLLSGAIPEGADAFVWEWPKGYGQSVVRTNYRVQEDDSEEGFAAFFPDGDRSAPIPLRGIEQSTWDVFLTYLEVGFTHIIPKGLDHILFVVGLFLLSTKLNPLIWQVTSFTLAHSVTLALGVFGLVNISPSIVEPLIAASIVYVCIENILTDKLQKWRPVIVFLFGLLHGLGFAGVLQDIGLVREHYIAGLISFNIGVELGQLMVIAICFFAVGLWFQSKSWYRERITIPTSMVIAGIGAWWFLERTVLA